jgi:hypothetical protein
VTEVVRHEDEAPADEAPTVLHEVWILRKEPAAGAVGVWLRHYEALCGYII